MAGAPPRTLLRGGEGLRTYAQTPKLHPIVQEHSVAPYAATSFGVERPLSASRAAKAYLLGGTAPSSEASDMDREKEGLIASVPGALTKAAKINLAAAKEMASSAVTAFVDTATGREKHRRGKKRVSKKKASSASKRRKARSSAATKRASTSKRRVSKRTAAKKPALKGGQARRRTASKARGSSSKTRRESKSRAR